MDSVMYEDVVTFCPDLDTFRIELTVHDHVDEEGKPELSLTKTPVLKKLGKGADKTLALVRLVGQQCRDTLASLEHLEVLGTYEQVFSDPGKLKKYNSVYDRTPQEIICPETGEVSLYIPPDKFCVFC